MVTGLLGQAAVCVFSGEHSGEGFAPAFRCSVDIAVYAQAICQMHPWKIKFAVALVVYLRRHHRGVPGRAGGLAVTPDPLVAEHGVDGAGVDHPLAASRLCGVESVVCISR